MYKKHPAAIPPENENIKIWRYMDVVKFLSLLEEKVLYFNRTNNFEDPSEGSWPVLNKLLFKEWAKKSEKNKSIYTFHMQFSEVTRSATAINCWHMNTEESMAMWKIYSLKNQGIAITNTYNKLKNSIDDEENISIGIVKYTPQDSIISFDQGWNAIFNKNLAMSMKRN